MILKIDNLNYKSNKIDFSYSIPTQNTNDLTQLFEIDVEITRNEKKATRKCDVLFQVITLKEKQTIDLFGFNYSFAKWEEIFKNQGKTPTQNI